MERVQLNPRPPLRGPGRPVGSRNKVTVQLHQALMEACERVGRDKNGKDGAVGYLMRLAIQNPKVFARLLEKIIPVKFDGVIQHTARQTYETVDDLREELKARGLPMQMIDVTPTRPLRGTVDQLEAAE